MLKYLISLLIPVITFCQEIDIKSNKIDNNQIANDSIALNMLINLADSLWDQESYDLYEDVYLEIEKKFNKSNINISDYNKDLISYKLGQFYYGLFYDYDLDSCVLGEKAYNYVYETRSFEEAAQILLDLTPPLENYIINRGFF